MTVGTVTGVKIGADFPDHVRAQAAAFRWPHGRLSMLSDKDVLTTGEVARICNVAPRTVSKWFDTGQIKGYRIPGSRDRRIPVSELNRFMREHGIPMEGVFSGSTRVLIVDDDREIVEVLQKVLTEKTQYEVRTATSAFVAGVECERFQPQVMLLDLHLEGADATDVVRFAHRNEAWLGLRVVAMSGKLTDGQAHGLRAQGFDDFLKKPFQVRQVIDAIENSTTASRRAA